MKLPRRRHISKSIICRILRYAPFGLAIRIGMRVILSRVVELWTTTGDHRLVPSRSCQKCYRLRHRVWSRLLRIYRRGYLPLARASFRCLSRALFRLGLPRIGRLNHVESQTLKASLSGGTKSAPVAIRRSDRLRLRSRARRKSLLHRLSLAGAPVPVVRRSPDQVLNLAYSRARNRSLLERHSYRDARSLLNLTDRRSLGRRRTVRRGRR